MAIEEQEKPNGSKTERSRKDPPVRAFRAVDVQRGQGLPGQGRRLEPRGGDPGGNGAGPPPPPGSLEALVGWLSERVAADVQRGLAETLEGAPPLEVAAAAETWRGLLATLPPCADCATQATRQADDGVHHCDRHGSDDAADMPSAPIVRVLLLRLAGDS